MSDVGIALLLLVPIVIVIVILKGASKRRKNKIQKRIDTYIAEAARQTGITPTYQKQLVHQTFIIDEKLRKLLVVEHNGVYSFETYPLNAIKSILVQNDTQSYQPEGQRPEVITTRIGIELTFSKPAEQKYLVLYDYLEHNVYLINEFQKEAQQLREIIEKASRANQ